MESKKSGSSSTIRMRFFMEGHCTEIRKLSRDFSDPLQAPIHDVEMARGTGHNKAVPDFMKAEPARKGIWFFQAEDDSSHGIEKPAQNQGQEPVMFDVLVNRLGDENSQPPHADIKGEYESARNVGKTHLQNNSHHAQGPDQSEDRPAKRVVQQQETERSEAPGDHDEDGVVIKLSEKMIRLRGSVHAVMQGACGEHGDQSETVDGKPDPLEQAPALVRAKEEKGTTNQ